MNSENMGGESRPGRRRVLKLGGVILVCGILLIGIRESDAETSRNIFDEGMGQLNQPDSVYARRLLEGVRGANGIVCGAVDRAFDTGFWSHSLSTIIETDFADPASVEVAQWIGRRRFDASVLPTARAGLRSDDACVRRVSARILGNTRDRDALPGELRAELSASDARTRSAALFALGFAGRESSIPAVRERLSDSNRDVRVAAIWALANIGDTAISATIVSLLERDDDPVVRSAAAWALGRLHD